MGDGWRGNRHGLGRVHSPETRQITGTRADLIVTESPHLLPDQAHFHVSSFLGGTDRRINRIAHQRIGRKGRETCRDQVPRWLGKRQFWDAAK